MQLNASSGAVAKLVYIQLYPGDWVKDTRFLSADAKGCWVDTLCVLFDAPNRGLLSQSVDGWARLWAVQVEQAREIIDQLSKGVAEVGEQGGQVTIGNRRMMREELKREEDRCRKSKDPPRLLRIYSGVFPDLFRDHSEPIPEKNSDIPDTRYQIPEGESISAREIVAAWVKGQASREALEFVANLIESGEDPAKLLEQTKAHAAVISELGAHNNKFTPSALKFFRSGRYADDPEGTREQLTPKTSEPPQRPQDAAAELVEVPEL